MVIFHKATTLRLRTVPMLGPGSTAACRRQPVTATGCSSLPEAALPIVAVICALPRAALHDTNVVVGLLMATSVLRHWSIQAVNVNNLLSCTCCSNIISGYCYTHPISNFISCGCYTNTISNSISCYNNAAITAGYYLTIVIGNFTSSGNCRTNASMQCSANNVVRIMSTVVDESLRETTDVLVGQDDGKTHAIAGHALAKTTEVLLGLVLCFELVLQSINIEHGRVVHSDKNVATMIESIVDLVGDALLGHVGEQMLRQHRSPNLGIQSCGSPYTLLRDTTHTDTQTPTH